MPITVENSLFKSGLLVWWCQKEMFTWVPAVASLTLHVCVLSHFSNVWLFATPYTIICQAPLCMGFSRKEYWSGFPCPPPGDHPDSGIKLASLRSPALADNSLPLGPPGKSSLILGNWKGTQIVKKTWSLSSLCEAFSSSMCTQGKIRVGKMGRTFVYLFWEGLF